ncbi:sugar phosphate isomerase/epimerase family protein [Gracilibacillus alcaliphilus]|uniref:sugar phosphate isomerase/epimerase family protein n=1 Tax=Gracilibacillus alcaliphilus TaxID=1401441 RepID=UPI00195955FE|nr:sugar phosphate isomerase/epimerase family protein [Gracilibacillus alcaliphilus]MBM7677453.1 sugar phosphate isomerase/epimerase [Gracilibacillus alcaliphilus]
MKIGLSSYSLFAAMKSNEMTILDVIDWTSEQGFEHIEIVPNLGFKWEEDQLIDQVRERAQEKGLELSNYAIGANFIQPNEAAYQAEIQRVKDEVDIANRLGVKLMRHDIATRDISETTIANFEKDLPSLVAACQEIADYASQYGITTSIENHGFYVQLSERVQTVINHVNRPNFKTTMDVGNFLCADEEPIAAVKKNISFASMVHIKDFYRRPAHLYPGEGWLQTIAGNYLRGAIVGHGDINMREILKVIKESDYKGYLSIEFEGIEESKLASKISLANLTRMWQEV